MEIGELAANIAMIGGTLIGVNYSTMKLLQKVDGTLDKIKEILEYAKELRNSRDKAPQPKRTTSKRQHSNRQPKHSPKEVR